MQQKLKWEKFVREQELQQQRERNAEKLVQKDADMVKYINRFGMVSWSLFVSQGAFVCVYICVCHSLFVYVRMCVCVCMCVCKLHISVWLFPFQLHQTKLGLELASWHYHSHVIGQRMWAMEQLHWNKHRTDQLVQYRRAVLSSSHSTG